jgi:hypothetical protein
VTSVKPNGISDDHLEVDDVITRINGEDTSNLTFQEMRNAVVTSLALELEVVRVLAQKPRSKVAAMAKEYSKQGSPSIVRSSSLWSNSSAFGDDVGVCRGTDDHSFVGFFCLVHAFCCQKM